MPAAASGLAAAAALVTTVTAMDNQGLGGSSVLLRCVVDLGELKARAGIGEGRQGPALEYLGLKLVRCAQPIDELQSQITIVEGASDGCQIICDALQLAGVGGDRHVAAGCAAEGLAEEEVARGLVVEEELVQSCPCRAGEAVGALNKAVELVGEGAHEPQRYVDVDGAP
jgi:hypothetical protein